MHDLVCRAIVVYGIQSSNWSTLQCIKNIKSNWINRPNEAIRCSNEKPLLVNKLLFLTHIISMPIDRVSRYRENKQQWHFHMDALFLLLLFSMKLQSFNNIKASFVFVRCFVFVAIICCISLESCWTVIIRSCIRKQWSFCKFIFPQIKRFQNSNPVLKVI